MDLSDEAVSSAAVSSRIASQRTLDGRGRRFARTAAAFLVLGAIGAGICGCTNDREISDKHKQALEQEDE